VAGDEFGDLGVGHCILHAMVDTAMFDCNYILFLDVKYCRRQSKFNDRQNLYWNSGKSSYQLPELRRKWSLGMKDHSFVC
jgi:hypothetical protein